MMCMWTELYFWLTSLHYLLFQLASVRVLLCLIFYLDFFSAKTLAILIMQRSYCWSPQSRLNIPQVQPLCITKQEPAVPEQCVVSGWGYTTPEGDLAEVLAGSPVPTVSNAFCGSPHGYGDNFNGDIQLCAGNLTGGVDSCHGDSGGSFDGLSFTE